MRENKFIRRSGIVFCVAALGLLLLLFIGSALPASLTEHVNADIVLLVVAGVAFLGVVCGALAFNTIQGKVTLGGSLIVLLVALALFRTVLVLA